MSIAGRAERPFNPKLPLVLVGLQSEYQIFVSDEKYNAKQSCSHDVERHVGRVTTC